MDTIFMNSENSRTSDPHRLLLNISHKLNLKKVINMLLYQTLAFTIHGKNQLRHGMKSLNYLMDHILYEITFNIFKKKNKTVNDNSSIRIYINKTEN